MRALILSCNTGGGHNSAAAAIAQAAEAQGWQVDIRDFMTFSDGWFSHRVGGMYVWIVKHMPFVFGAMYKLGGVISSPRRKSPIYYANRRPARGLESYLSEERCDVIFVPHLFPAEALTYLRTEGRLEQPVIAVATDYTCVPFWEETDCDLYAIPHEALAAEFVRHGVLSEKLAVTGIPLRKEFTALPDKHSARERLGLPKDGVIHLVMSGSMGFGRVEYMAAKLRKSIRPGDSMVIICGSDKRLRRSLEKRFSKDKNVFIEGYTDKVAAYLAACDVVYTKPGGLSSTEAAAARTALVHTSPIPGCETVNAAFFSALGMSAAPRGVRRQLQAGLELAQSAEKRRAMISAQEKNIAPDSASKVVRLALRFERAEKA